MRIANVYNHLNGLEYLMCRKPKLLKEIEDAIAAIDANMFTKHSKDKAKFGKTLYNQVAINNELKRLLYSVGWCEKRVPYCVTDDMETAKEISQISDANKQEEIILQRNCRLFKTYNQIDFVKEDVAIEVQFGKYAFVAYDLHVKHTFFFLRNEINVGVEIIPTHKMMRKLDSGIGWFENEAANVIREGRSNPTVPIVMMGVEPEDIEI